MIPLFLMTASLRLLATHVLNVVIYIETNIVLVLPGTQIHSVTYSAEQFTLFTVNHGPEIHLQMASSNL